MVIDFSNCEKIDNKVFVYHNFLSEDMIKEIIDRAIDKDYITLEFSDIHVTNSINIDHDKILFNHCNLLLKPSKNILIDGFTFVHVQKGNSWGLHEDSQSYANFEEKGKIYYAGVIYLNDFEGGAVVYPNINKKYKAKKGDLLLHDAFEMHYVEEVESDKRYTVTLYIWEPKNNYIENK